MKMMSADVEEATFTRMDAGTIKLHLRPAVRPAGLSEASLHRALKDVADNARRRMTANNCGGLPGPAVESQSILRRIIEFLTSKRRES